MSPRATFVDTNAIPRNGDFEIPWLVLRLAEVLAGNRKHLKPFPYMPHAFDARDDELLRTKRYSIYDQMRRHPVIKDALRSKRSTLLRNWHVPPSREGDPIAETVAKFLNDQLLRLKGGFLRGARRLTLAWEYGFEFQEQEREILAYGRWAGMVGLKAWHHRLQHFLDPVRDEKTGKVFIRQFLGQGESPLETPASSGMYYVHQPELDPLRGEADLRAAYDDWWASDTTRKLYLIHLETQGSGKVVVGYDDSIKKLSPDQLGHAQKIVDNWQTILGIVKIPGLTIDIQQGEPSGDHYKSALEFFDDRLRKAIGKPGLLGDSQSGGGLAGGATGLGGVQQEQHFDELDEPKSDLEDLIPEQCFRPLLEMNAIPLEYLSGFVFSSPDQRDGANENAEFLRGVQAGVLKVREGDEDRYRQNGNWLSVEESGEPTAAAAPSPDGTMAFGPGAIELSQFLYGASLSPRRLVPVAKPALRAFAASYDEDPSLWVCVPLPEPLEQKLLALPGVAPPEKLHVTLAYCGRRSELAVDDVQRATLADAFRAIGAECAPLQAKVQGIGRFSASETSDGKDVVYASVDAVGLVELRQLIAKALDSVGLPPKTEHDFVPHITLAQIEPDAPTPVERIEHEPFVIDRFVLEVFGERFEFSLQGSKVRPFAVKLAVENKLSPVLQQVTEMLGATARTFAAEDTLLRDVDRLAADYTQELGYLWARALWNLWGEVEKVFLDDAFTPDEKIVLMRTVDSMVDVEPFAKCYIQGHREALQLGVDAGKRLTEGRAFDASSVNPAGADSLGALEALLKAKSYTVADGMKVEVAQKLRWLLQGSFDSGEGYKVTQRKLSEKLSELAGAKLIAPGPSPGMTYRSPLVQETIVRTNFANIAEKGKVDVWKRNPAFVAGIERFEVIENGLGGKSRNHPLSKYVVGLRIPIDHELINEFTGAMHYNERGGSKPITARRAEEPDFTWSTDAEIRRAYEWKQKLSRDFV